MAAHKLQPEMGPAPMLPSLALGVSGLYLSLYLHYGFVGFLPLWLKATGSSAAEIGLLMAIPLILRLLTVAPFSAWVGRRRRVRDAIIATALASAVIVSFLLNEPGHIGRVAIFLAFSIAWDQIPVLTDAYAVMAVRSQSLDFGRLRVWGSIGVVLSSAAAGWAIGLIGLTQLPAIIAALLILPAAVAFLLPQDGKLSAAEGEALGNWRDVLRDRTLLKAMAAVSFIMGSHGVLTSFAAIQWSARGVSTGTIGMLQALAVAAEIAAFWFGVKMLGKRDPMILIGIAAATAVLRWMIMATDPSLGILIATQLLHGITSTGAILGIMLIIARRVPAALSATAQGVNAVIMGLVLSVVTAGSGLLWDHGLATAYLAMAACAAIGFILTWPFRRAPDAVAVSLA
jgi:PPP family 3-phenylpropionic acid transporter